MNISDIFKQDWEFYLSRNIPVWHNSLTGEFLPTGLKRYKLFSSYDPFRIHRGFDSDFYFSVTGENNVGNFRKELSKKLAQPSFLKFLITNYSKDGQKLILESKKLTADYQSLKSFFEFYGKCTALLDITSHASKILTDKAMDLLKDNPMRQDIIVYYSTPKKLAPVQRLELEVQKIIRHKFDLCKSAELLFKKYNWIPVSFVGEPWDKNYFIDLLKNAKSTNFPMVKKLKVKIDKEIKQTLKALADITYLNEYRKSIFCQVSFNIRPVFNQIANRYGLKDWQNLGLLAHDEILRIVKYGDDMRSEIEKRKKQPIAVYALGKKTGLVHEDVVKEFERKYKAEYKNISQFSGMVANRGKCRGEVKIIFDLKDFNKFKIGDILVAKMTSVDYLPIMKKAAAFVTDEGGLACHAAVVSREFGLPCIIGTKVATSILKDGDVVEVDANNGIVRKI